MSRKKIQQPTAYRKGVGVVLFNTGGLVWIGRRIVNSSHEVEHYWQFPQGGIDNGETPAQAVVRELREETGIKQTDIIGCTEDWLCYDLPESLIGVAWGGGYRGQTQKWFALRFLGSDDDIDLSSHAKPEFDAWRWVRLSEAVNLIVPFKRNLYAKLFNEFNHFSD
jgi:putative (di)nucleoside polyphosphate hydrolase